MHTRKPILISLLLLLCFSLLLVGCNSAAAPQLAEDGLLLYPGVTWNATAEDTLAALKLTTEDCTVIKDIPFSSDGASTSIGEYTLEADGQKFLGQPATLELRFRQYAQDAPMGLYGIAVRCGDDVDMAALKNTLTELLGVPTETNDHVVFWDSAKKMTEFMGDSAYQAALAQMQALDEKFGGDNVAYFESTPAVRIQWTDDSSILTYNEHRDDWDTEYNQIIFTAPMVEAIQRYQD